MEMILSMIAGDAIERMQRTKAPVEIRQEYKDLEDQYISTYKYFLNKSLRYPKKWIENKEGANVLVGIKKDNGEFSISSVKILSKSKNLNDSEIYNEVEKTLKKTNDEYKLSNLNINKDEFELPINWHFR